MGNEFNSSRREFVKKAAYVAPAILTLQAAPAFANSGSNDKNPEGLRIKWRKKRGDGKD